MPAISDNLIHFLGRNFKDAPNQQYEIFKSIINKGLRCSDITINVGGVGNFVTNKCVCFTDIPLSECDEHTANYGKFGIGFKKSYVKRLGGNPARYYVNHLPLGTEARGLMGVNLNYHISLLVRLQNSLKENDKFTIYDHQGEVILTTKELNEWLGQQIMILSYEKETGDLGPALDDTGREDPYYKEREWRIVPYNKNIENNTVYLDEEDKFYYATFDRKDVNVIVTPNEDFRTIVLRYILGFEIETDVRLKKFAKNPPPVVTYDDLHKW